MKIIDKCFGEKSNEHSNYYERIIKNNNPYIRFYTVVNNEFDWYICNQNYLIIASVTPFDNMLEHEYQKTKRCIKLKNILNENY